MIDNFLVCERLVIRPHPIFSRYDGWCSCPCAVCYSITGFTRDPGWNIFFLYQHGVSKVRQRMCVFHYVHRASGRVFESFRGNIISIGSTIPGRHNVSINYYSQIINTRILSYRNVFKIGIPFSTSNIYQSCILLVFL